MALALSTSGQSPNLVHGARGGARARPADHRVHGQGRRAPRRRSPTTASSCRRSASTASRRRTWRCTTSSGTSCTSRSEKTMSSERGRAGALALDAVPLPLADSRTAILLGHGSGGKHDRRSHRALLPARVPQRVPRASSTTRRSSTSAGARLAFTTDAYVVTPLFFPGGDIGDPRRATARSTTSRWRAPGRSISRPRSSSRRASRSPTWSASWHR